MKKRFQTVFKRVIFAISILAALVIALYFFVRHINSYNIMNDTLGTCAITITGRSTVRGNEVITISAKYNKEQATFIAYVFNYRKELRNDQIQAVWLDGEDMILISLSGDDDFLQIVPIFLEPNFYIEDIYSTDHGRKYIDLMVE